MMTADKAYEIFSEFYDNTRIIKGEKFAEVMAAYYYIYSSYVIVDHHDVEDVTKNLMIGATETIAYIAGLNREEMGEAYKMAMQIVKQIWVDSL